MEKSWNIPKSEQKLRPILHAVHESVSSSTIRGEVETALGVVQHKKWYYLGISKRHHDMIQRHGDSHYLTALVLPHKMQT